MKQRKNSADNTKLHSPKRFASTLPAQSLCWLSSISFLSSGFVLAQAETSIDNLVPTVENSQPAAVTPVKKDTAATEAPPQTSFSERRTRLKKRLRQQVSLSSEPVRRLTPKTESSEPAVVLRRSRTNTENSGNSVTLRRLRQQEEKPEVRIRQQEEKPEVRISQPTATLRQEKPQVPQAPRTIPEKVPEVAQPLNNPNIGVSANTEKPKDYNNAYIDPTDYNNAVRDDYEAPDSVVISERSSNCKTVLSQAVRDRLCGSSPVRQRQNQPVAQSNTRPIAKQTPNWLRRSQASQVAMSPLVRRVSPTQNNSEVHSTRIGPINLNNRELHTARTDSNTVNNSELRPTRTLPNSVSRSNWRSNRIASSMGVSKNEYRPNRFIPNNFSPTTTVRSTSIAPPVGNLSVPMTADNLAPRPSNVVYDIPLASALPKVPNNNTVAYNATGLIFPLSVPAPVSSLFGWRVHPITGDRRFHSGTDLAGAMGTPVLAAATGQVEIADYVGGYGLTVIVNHHSAQQTLYGHMSEVFVQPGQIVQQGTVIGRVGSTGNSTGPHLHFELRQLTPEGWVATDPGVPLQAALSQLVQVLQTAQVSQQPGG